MRQLPDEHASELPHAQGRTGVGPAPHVDERLRRHAPRRRLRTQGRGIRIASLVTLLLAVLAVCQRVGQRQAQAFADRVHRSEVAGELFEGEPPVACNRNRGMEACKDTRMGTRSQSQRWRKGRTAAALHPEPVSCTKHARLKTGSGPHHAHVTACQWRLHTVAALPRSQPEGSKPANG